MAIRNSNKQDNRKANVQPNHLPASLSVDVSVNGELLGTIGVPQGNKLSEKGNISFSGGIRPAAGWQLPVVTTAEDTLKTLSISVEGVALSMAASGVHASEAGNPTVCHSALVEVPSSTPDVEPLRYMAQVYVTYSNAKECFTLSVSIFKAGTPTSGPAIVGEISGGFVLENA